MHKFPYYFLAYLDLSVILFVCRLPFFYGGLAVLPGVARAILVIEDVVVEDVE